MRTMFSLLVCAPAAASKITHCLHIARGQNEEASNTSSQAHSIVCKVSTKVYLCFLGMKSISLICMLNSENSQQRKCRYDTRTCVDEN